MKKNIFVFLTVLCMGVIFYFSSQNGEVSAMQSESVLKFLESVFPRLKELDHLKLLHILRKLAHFFLYFLMALFVYNSQKKDKKIPIKVSITILVVFLYACFDEYHQSFVYGRGVSFHDVFIDLFGGLTAIFMLSLM